MGKKMTQERRDKIIDRIESLMVMGFNQRRIVQTIHAEFGANRGTVETMIRTVRDIWSREAKGLDKERIRDERREMARSILARSLERKKPVRNKSGEIVVKGRGDKKAPVMYADPDVKTAARVIDTLCRLDGVFEDHLVLSGKEGLSTLLAAMRNGENTEADAPPETTPCPTCGIVIKRGADGVYKCEACGYEGQPQTEAT